jgi:hypothetical protein
MDDGVASPSSSARRTLARDLAASVVVGIIRARAGGGGTDSPIVTRQGDPFVRTHESPRGVRRDRARRAMCDV